MIRPLLAGALALLVVSSEVDAQRAAPLVLQVAPSARVAGLADAFVAGRGVDAVFSNPAQVGLTNGTLLSAARFSDASTLAALATSTSFGPVSFGVGAQWLDYGAAEVVFPGGGRPGAFPTRPGGLIERGPVSARSIAATAALATRVKGFRVGAAIKYAEEFVPPSKAGVTAVDLGMSREVGRFTAALAVQHLGADLELGAQTADLATRATLGAMLRPMRIGTFFDLLAVGSVSRERGGRITPAAGAEVIYVPLEGFSFSLRAGVRRPEEAPAGTGREAWTVGVSAGMDRVVLDYAFEPIRGTGDGHRIGVRIH